MSEPDSEIVLPFSNSTEYETVHGFYNYSAQCLCSIIIVVNFCVLISSGLLLKTGQQCRATYMYLGNISLSDMVIGIVTLFILLCPHQFNSKFLCTLSIGLSSTAGLTSVYSIALIAVDRYLYILNGLHYHRYITTRHSHCMVALIWLVAAAFGFASIFAWQNPKHEHQVCWFSSLISRKIALLLVFVGVLPMILIVVLYSIILRSAFKIMSRSETPSISHIETNPRDLCGQVETTSYSVNDHLPSKGIRSLGLRCCQGSSISLVMRPPFCKNKWKAVKIVVFTAGAFVVTWFPNFITWILYSYCDYSTEPHYCGTLSYLLNNPMSLLSLSNSLLNPIIYAWWHPGFRKSAKKMYSKFLRKDPSTESADSGPKNSSLKQRQEFDI